MSGTPAVFVAGVGMTRFGRHRGTDAKALARSAVDTALADAGLDAWAIESVFFADASHGHMEIDLAPEKRIPC